MIGIVIYGQHQKAKTRRARLRLRTIKLEQETKEMRTQIENNIKKAKSSLKEYKNAKNRFMSSIDNPDDGSTS